MPLARFSPATRAWFEAAFGEPTDSQQKGWPAIAGGDHTLLLAPTGSGKTLAAFLWAIDTLSTRPAPPPDRRTRVLYLSPLRALAVDVEKNLRAPLTGIEEAAGRLGTQLAHVPEVGVRTGDTDARERRRLLAHPPDILITTPESLYLMLTSSARETLRGVQTVIVDEIHALAPSKRGAHLMLSLERLEALTDRPPQRIGLSATQRPLEEIARFLGGSSAPGTPRPVTVIDAGRRKVLDLEVIVPVEDMGAIQPSTEALPRNPALGADVRSIWPSIHPVLLDLIGHHRSTIVFVNERRGAERLASRLNEAAGTEVARAHHGSIAREQRVEVEDALKEGRLPAIVATSSLELGIDMGAVDLVIQVGAPGSVASGIQRIGRAGHHVGAPSVGKLFPKYRGDLLETAVIAERMLSSEIESTAYPRNPLDVLAQQLVAMTAVDAWDVDELFATIRRAAPFADCTRAIFDAVLDMLSGRYPSDAFAQLRPRVVWDRARGTVRAREGAGRIAITSGGTIADRGLFGVFTTDGSRVGELDEECVYESRRGEVMLLGATSWRIEEITRDRVIVAHAPGEHGKLPFWKAPGPGRPVELGRAIGRFTRELHGRGRDEAIATLQRDLRLDPLAARNLVAYVAEQAEAGAVPDDRTVVVERFRDELGDWRICVLTPLGARVHAPWALAIEARLLARFGPGAQVLWSDDGIVVRLPEAVEDLPLEEFLFDPQTIEDEVVATLPGTALFASVFREAAARALLLPRRRPGMRTPMWQQRQRSADLLAAASSHAQFPILLEATRECIRDHFDVPALAGLMADLAARRVRMVPVDTDQASPFARSLLLKWVSVFMYEGDAPLAERRAAALSLDRALLRDLLGSDDLRSLLDQDAITEVERELQRLAPGCAARGADAIHDLLRDLGPLDDEQIAARAAADAPAAIAALAAEGRVIPVQVAGARRLAAVEDAARLRDGLGSPLPADVPAAFTAPTEDAIVDLVARFARTHGPFRAQDAAAWLGLDTDRVLIALGALEAAGGLLRGGFRPGGGDDDWCDAAVLARIRGRSLAKLRRQIEPVDHATFARFLPAWQGADHPRGGAGVLEAAIEHLEGAAIPASILEHDVLPDRVQGYRPADLDALIAAGGLVWVGAGTLGKAGGKIRLVRRGGAGAPETPPTAVPDGALHDAIRTRLADRGASFWPDLVQAAQTADEAAVLAALWDLVWSGEVTNDTLAPLRAFVGWSGRRRATGSRPRPGALRRDGPPAGSGRWSLVADMARDDVAPTERLHALATRLLHRNGIVTRPAVAAEDVPGGFGALYPVLRAMEEGGHVRRGYFVAGSGAAQFASPGAVDRLRGARTGLDTAWTLAAADPAQPYGAALPWPPAGGRPSRSAGAYLVLAGGEPAAFLERGGRTLFTFDGADPDSWVDQIASLAKDGRVQRLEIRSIDQIAALEHPAAAALRSAGFTDGYRGLTLRG